MSLKGLVLEEWRFVPPFTSHPPASTKLNIIRHPSMDSSAELSKGISKR